MSMAPDTATLLAQRSQTDKGRVYAMTTGSAQFIAVCRRSKGVSMSTSRR